MRILGRGGVFFLEEREEIDDGKNGKEEEPGDAGGEEAAEGVSRPEDGEGEVERKKREEEDAAIGDAGEVFEDFGFRDSSSGGAIFRDGVARRAFFWDGLTRSESEKVREGDEVEEGEPDEGEGELEVHGGAGAEGDDGVVGEKEDGGQEVEEAPEGAAEEFFQRAHCGSPVVLVSEGVLAGFSIGVVLAAGVAAAVLVVLAVLVTRAAIFWRKTSGEKLFAEFWIVSRSKSAGLKVLRALARDSGVCSEKRRPFLPGPSV